MTSKGNLYHEIPASLPEEHVTIVARGEDVRVERIVSRGHRSPDGFWYDQAKHEWVAVIAGRARLRFDDGADLELGPGDHVTIPAHRRHRVEWTDPEQETIWLAVFYREAG
ncbi:MAG TPA: cupin domain-containing protein [Longimicrobiaceae bacterium]